MTPVVRVLVVDDSEAYRSGLQAVIEATSGFDLHGAVATGNEALAVVESGEPPHLVVMDVHLGDDSGIDVTRRLVEVVPEVRVVLASTMEEADLPADARTCGAAGFVPKRLLGPRTLGEVWSGAYDWS